MPEGAVVVPAGAAGGVACGLEATMRSRLGPETKLRITNDTEGEVHLYWLDYAGKRRSFGKLAPGESALKQTYAGHIWVIADVEGRCLATGVATERMGELRASGVASPARENDR